ncbi:uncharacterized protein AB9X84_024133 isoform 1-T2 [Acanthopagrus schlegelii]
MARRAKADAREITSSNSKPTYSDKDALLKYFVPAPANPQPPADTPTSATLCDQQRVFLSPPSQRSPASSISSISAQPVTKHTSLPQTGKLVHSPSIDDLRTQPYCGLSCSV